MHPHEDWLELAALDAVGQLTAREHERLQQHLNECRECLSEAQSFAEVTKNWLPVGSNPRGRPFAKDERGQREQFISKAQLEGLRFSAEATRQRHSWRARISSWNTAPTGAAFATAVCLLVVGTLVIPNSVRLKTAARLQAIKATGDTDEVRKTNQQLQAQLIAVQQQYELEHDKVASLEEQKSETLRQVSQLEQSLAASQQQSARAREELARALSNSNEESKLLAADLQRLDSLRAELEQVKNARAADQATMVAQQYKVSDLTQQLRLQSASVERDRELMSASRDIRDLMSARNLHIVDVHDIDPKGKTRKAFGRMFYTEGKSLVFYAYDLETKGMKDAGFQVWGQKTDDTRHAVSLGMLYSDDKKQSRWVLKYDDPKVLAEIDSVFVTVESPGGSKKPSGKKMMYAYLLNEANHP